MRMQRNCNNELKLNSIEKQRKRRVAGRIIIILKAKVNKRRNFVRIIMIQKNEEKIIGKSFEITQPNRNHYV